MIVGIRGRNGFVGVDPAIPHVVYGNREQIGAWESIELTKHDNNMFDARFTATNLQLSIQPDGKLETRPAGTFGEYEMFFATEQPDGVSMLYRIKDNVVIRCLLIEAVK